MTDVSITGLPEQRISFTEKNQEWKEACVEAITRMSGVNTLENKRRMRINYNLMVNKIMDSDFKHFTELYKDVKGGFPAKFSKSNILKSKIDVLIGEKISRIFDFKVVAVDEDSVTKASEEKGKLVQQMLQQIWIGELQAQGVNVNDPKLMQQQITPEWIERYMKFSYTDMRETTAQKALEYLLRFCKVKEKFKDGWYDFLVAGFPVFYVSVISGEPSLKRRNPENIDWQNSPDVKYIQDSEWVKYYSKLTLSDIYDEYGKFLTEEQRVKLDKLKNTMDRSFISPSMGNIQIRMSDVDDADGFLNNKFGNHSLLGLIDVWHVCWKSKRKIGFLKYIDQNSMLQETIVTEEYRMDKSIGDISIEWEWINETWEGVKIGEDIYINVQPLPFQDVSLDNPNKVFFPYIGGGMDLNTEPVSLVEIMKPLLYDYIEVLYRLKLSLARNKDKILLMDIAQIPSNIGIDKWMYYMDVLGVSFINSFEEGKDKFAGQRPTFNQFRELDMSIARIIDQYIMLLDKIEDMMGQISGVNRQREGSITQNDLASTTERAVVQSSHITEKYFSHAAEIERSVLEALLQVSKQAWMEGKKAQYIHPDMSREILSIDGGMLNDAEFGVFVSDGGKDTAAINAMKQMSQTLVQKGASVSKVIEILTSESIVYIKNKIKEIEADEQAQAQQQQQMELQIQQQQQALNEKHHQENLDMKKYEIDTKAETEIYKGQMSTLLGQGEVDANKNGKADQIEWAKLALAERKQKANEMEAKMKGEHDKEKLNVEREKMKHEEKLHTKDKKLQEKEIAVKKIAAKKKSSGK